MIENFPMFLPFTNERTYSVLGYIGEVDEYKDNKGYIDKETGKIYICSKDKEPAHNDVPILRVSEDSIEKVDVNSTQTIEAFSVDRLYSLSYDNIIETTAEDEVLYNAEELADMNAASSVYIPIINEDDDPLKKIVKKIIIEKGIDINRLKHKMPKKYGLTNMKSALIGKTKMSIANFNMWCELLGVDYEITINDNGSDKIDPLKLTLHYLSYRDRIEEIGNN